MLIDLLPAFSRFNVERFPASLVVLIPYGDVRGPRTPAPLVTQGPKLEHVYEAQGGQHFLAFQLQPSGAPSYVDNDATGWEFSLHITDEGNRGHSYASMVLIQEGSRWVARLRDGRTAFALDVTVPEFDPSVQDSLAFDEGLGTHIPDVWERLMATEEPA
jgi:hypothetical protein